MLDLGWTEIVVIAVVAILVVGPKDLPRMLRSFGQTLGQLRRSANEFKRQFDDALREAEREADFEDARKSVQSLNRADPLSGLKKSIEKDFNAANKAAGTAAKSGNGSVETAAAEQGSADSADKAAKPAGKAAGPKRQSTGKPAAAKAKPAGAEKPQSGPASTGSADGAQARRDSDAA